MKVTEKVKKEMKQWVKALRSGKYKQGQNALCSLNEKSYCCLGVGTKLLFPKTKLFHEEKNGRKYSIGTPDMILDDKVHKSWISEINDDFYKKTEINLSSLNDLGFIGDNNQYEKPLTFNEIADLVEAVYLLKVLEK